MTGEGLLFLLSPLLLALFGAPAMMLRPVSELGVAARLSAAFVAGTIAWTAWSTLLSLAGIPWMPQTTVSLLFISLGAAFALRMRRAVAPVSGSAAVTTPFAWLVSVLALAAGTGHMVLSSLTARATSADYLFFWGVKAIHFKALGAIDAALLADPFAVHMHSNYPPLLPLVYAWGIGVAGRIAWQFGLASCAIWIVAGFPLIRDLLARRLSRGEASAAASFWFLAMSLAVVASLSAGNAEPPLVLFGSVAVVALLVEDRDARARSRWLPAMALAGMVLTKNEGAIGVALIVAGTIARDMFERTPFRLLMARTVVLTAIPGTALSTWLAFEAVRGVPMIDRTREATGNMSLSHVGTIAKELLRNLEAGSWWIAWSFAALLLMAAWRSWRPVLPALALAVGILGFLVVYYLHYAGSELAVWIRWTTPRVSLGALSAAILAAAVGLGQGVIQKSRDEETGG